MSDPVRRVAIIAAIALAALAAGDAAPAHGASFTVDATHDAVDAAPGDGVCADAGGACTLRAAVDEANALPGADAIALPGGIYSGKLIIRDSLRIAAAGAATTILNGAAPEIGSVISVMSTYCGGPSPTVFSVEISGVSITGGQMQGGGVNNCGHSVRLTSVVIQGNGSAGLDGGGIWNGGTLTIVDSTIADNSAYRGAAILNDRAGAITVSNSTISGNDGYDAIYNWSANPVVMDHVTVLGPAPRPGSCAVICGPVQVRNTIIAPASEGLACGGPVTSLGHNLSSDGSCNLNGPGDLSNVQPQLTGLQNNGGTTLTHGLYPNSPAIDAGDNNGCPATDQRGVARPQGAACDIGAYEYVTPPTAPPTEPPADTPPPTHAATEPPTSGPTTPKPKGSPSPSPSATPSLNISSPAAGRQRSQPTFAAVLVDVPRSVPGVEEDAGGGVSTMAAGLATAGALGLAGSAASAGFFWYRRRRHRRG